MIIVNQNHNYHNKKSGNTSFTSYYTFREPQQTFMQKPLIMILHHQVKIKEAVTIL